MDAFGVMLGAIKKVQQTSSSGTFISYAIDDHAVNQFVASRLAELMLHGMLRCLLCFFVSTTICIHYVCLILFLQLFFSLNINELQYYCVSSDI